MKYKLNGREVSKKEWDAHHERRKAVVGDLLGDMLQSRCAPIMANSDRMFMEGANAQSVTHGMDELSKNRILERAKKAGISTHGKVYMGQLGSAENPMAWVSGIEDVRTSIKLQGRSSESLGIEAAEHDPEPDVPLAEDIVRDEIKNRCEADPELAVKLKENPAKIHELREAIIEKHGPQK